MSELKLEPLERLDLRKCTTVGDIVLAMSKCSFGARMLGEVAQKILGWIQQGKADTRRLRRHRNCWTPSNGCRTERLDSRDRALRPGRKARQGIV